MDRSADCEGRLTCFGLTEISSGMPCQIGSKMKPVGRFQVAIAIFGGSAFPTSIPQAPRKMVFTLTTAASENALLQAMAPAAVGREQRELLPHPGIGGNPNASRIMPVRAGYMIVRNSPSRPRPAVGHPDEIFGSRLCRMTGLRQPTWVLLWLDPATMHRNCRIRRNGGRSGGKCCT
jgi:hypothetical protein